MTVLPMEVDDQPPVENHAEEVVDANTIEVPDLDAIDEEFEHLVQPAPREAPQPAPPTEEERRAHSLGHRPLPCMVRVVCEVEGT